MKTVLNFSGRVPEVTDDRLRGYEHLVINGVSFYMLNVDDQKAKSEAIAEQAEELELVKSELRHYRAALSKLRPEAQIRAALEVANIYSEDAERAITAWRKIQELV